MRALCFKKKKKQKNVERSGKQNGVGELKGLHNACTFGYIIIIIIIIGGAVLSP
jgi:hypothetical protein